MLEGLVDFGAASLAALWIPVIVWTGLAAVTMLALALPRELHPVAGYRLRQGLLLALPTSVLLAPWLPVPDLLKPTLPVALGGSFGAAPPIPVGMAQSPGTQVAIGAIILGLATVAVVLLTLVRLSMLARDLQQLRRLRAAAPTLGDATATRALRELADRLDVQRPVKLLEGPDGSVPMTFHWWHPAIVVPCRLLDDPNAMRIVLTHELIHVRRHDYVWALLERLTLAAFAFHPLIWQLRRGVDCCRETSCDAEVMAAGLARPDEYAEVLVRTHDHAAVPMIAVAAGMATRSPTIKQRLESMKQFAHTNPTSRLRTGSALAAGLLVIVTATLAACTGRTEVAEPSEAPSPIVYVSPASSQIQEAMSTARRTLRRLEVELTYLQERIDELREQADAIPRTHPELPPQGEDYAAYSRLMQRLTLLNEMLGERIKQFEILRMKQETERRLKEPAS